MPTPTEHVSAFERRQRLIGIAWLVCATLCFACIDASAKWLNRTMPPLQTVTIRYIGAFLVIVLLLNPQTKPGILRTRRPALQVARGLGLVVASVCLITALHYLPLTATTALTFAAPLVVALLAGPLLGETLGPRRRIAVLVGFGGVLVVTQPWTGAFHPAMGLALLSACATALYSIITRILAAHDPAETTMFYTAIVGAVTVLPLVPFVWQTPSSRQDWTAIALLSVFGAAGHWLLILAHKKAPASVVAPFFYAQLIWALGLGAAVFDELPTAATLVGGGIVMSSGLYLLYRERVRHIRRARMWPYNRLQSTTRRARPRHDDDGRVENAQIRRTLPAESGTMRVPLLLLVACVSFVRNLAAAEPVPGTRVLLDPPPNFEKAEQFPGFIQKATNASIMISEVPGPYAEVTKGFTSSGLATKDMKLMKKEDVRAAGQAGVLLRATQDAYGTTFAKWMLAFPDGAKTVLIVATYPASEDGSLAEPLRKAILAATLSGPAPGLTEGLTFQLTEKPPLQISQRVGNSVILTTAEKSPNAPLLVIGSSATEDVRIPNYSAHAKARLRQTEHLERIDLLAEKPVEIGGLRGVTLVATGRDKKTGADQFLLQTTLYDENGYFIAQGLAPASERAAFEPLFEAIIATFRRKP